MVTWIVENWIGVTDNGDGSFVSFQLSAFHTCFNICNVLILIWFVKFIEKTVCKILPVKENDEDTRLRYITGGLLSTAELSVLEAQKEIALYAQRTRKMFGFVQELLHTKKGDEFNKLYSRIEKYESISDNMEIEIANYLNKVSEGRLSSESKTRIQSMLREVTEIESIGDSCYNLARTLNRKRQNSQEDFTEKQYEHISNMMNLVDGALEEMDKIITHRPSHHVDVNKSYNIENEINNYRNQLKSQNINDVNNQVYGYQLGVYYMDIIAECEKLGDYVINVVDATK
jgi:phosphate:Na+ symporter